MAQAPEPPLMDQFPEGPVMQKFPEQPMLVRTASGDFLCPSTTNASSLPGNTLRFDLERYANQARRRRCVGVNHGSREELLDFAERAANWTRNPSESLGVIINHKIQISNGCFAKDEHFTVDDIFEQRDGTEILFCTSILTNEKFVVKKIIPRTFNRFEVYVPAVSLTHIVKIYGLLYDVCDNRIWILMERLEGTWAEPKFRLLLLKSERDFYIHFMQVVKALAKIHRMGFQHRDIKPSNIGLRRVNDTWETVLIDLGSADSEGSRNSSGATLEYRPPEMCRTPFVCNPLSDIYSFGATVLKLLNRKTPWNQAGPWKVRGKQERREEKMIYILQNPNEILEEIPCTCTVNDSVSMDIEEQFREVLRRMLQPELSQRPSAEDLLRDSFLSQFIDQSDPTTLNTMQPLGNSSGYLMYGEVDETVGPVVPSVGNMGRELDEIEDDWSPAGYIPEFAAAGSNGSEEEESTGSDGSWPRPVIPKTVDDQSGSSSSGGITFE